MDWKKLDDKIVRSPRYLFFKKHKQIITMIEGIIVIGLMIGILIFIVQDREIKEQIKERCGYTTSTYDCVCDFNYVQDWKKMERGESISINISDENG